MRESAVIFLPSAKTKAGVPYVMELIFDPTIVEDPPMMPYLIERWLERFNKLEGVDVPSNSEQWELLKVETRTLEDMLTKETAILHKYDLVPKGV